VTRFGVRTGNRRSVVEALPRIRTDSTRHRVAHALRSAIVLGQLAPGDKLVERDVAERMGVSRGPVREALRQLEQEGLVVSHPWRGTEVLGVSQEEVEEVLVPVRLVLERAAFRKAASLLTGSDLKTLDRMVSEMRRAAESEDLEQLAELDVRFHDLVISRAGQPHCEQIWRSIAPRVKAYFFRDAVRRDPPAYFADEHQVLLDAVRSKDEAHLLGVLEEHILATIRLHRDLEPDAIETVPQEGGSSASAESEQR